MNPLCNNISPALNRASKLFFLIGQKTKYICFPDNSTNSSIDPKKKTVAIGQLLQRKSNLG